MANKSTRRPAAQQVADRRVRVAEMRKAEQARERRRRLFVWGGGGGVTLAVVVAIIVVAVLQGGGGTNTEVMPVAVTGPAYTQVAPKTITNDSGISGVTEYDTTVSSDSTSTDCTPADVVCHLHVTGTVDYALTPPVGGPHNADWMTCGVYDKAVPTERAVHNLEHGAVWITYRPNLTKGQVDALRSFVKKQAKVAKTQPSGKATADDRYLDLTPWASTSLPAPIVLSSWGAQLKVDSPTDPRIQQFVDKFRVRDDQTYEAGASCDDSGQGDGGTPLFA